LENQGGLHFAIHDFLLTRKQISARRAPLVFRTWPSTYLHLSIFNEEIDELYIETLCKQPLAAEDQRSTPRFTSTGLKFFNLPNDQLNLFRVNIAKLNIKQIYCKTSFETVYQKISQNHNSQFPKENITSQKENHAGASLH
jgi:hypothetical protein